MPNAFETKCDERQDFLAELGEIASRMAHEIRNPLNAIRMQVAVIRNKLLKPNETNLEVAKTQLERLEQEVLRVEKLTKAFLEYGRPPADEPECIRVAELLEDVATLVRPEFEQPGHTLCVEADLEATPLLVYMDRAKLRQVFMNLLSNARNAMESPGQVTLRLSRGSDGYISIHVDDSGVGIPDEAMPHIFEPFYSRSPQGDGLGLAIVKKIVDNANGTIRVHSRLGEGTHFEVILPIYTD